MTKYYIAKVNLYNNDMTAPHAPACYIFEIEHKLFFFSSFLILALKVFAQFTYIRVCNVLLAPCIGVVQCVIYKYYEVNQIVLTTFDRIQFFFLCHLCRCLDL